MRSNNSIYNTGADTGNVYTVPGTITCFHVEQIYNLWPAVRFRQDQNGLKVDRAGSAQVVEYLSYSIY